jgi:hypothetical protein
MSTGPCCRSIVSTADAVSSSSAPAVCVAPPCSQGTVLRHNGHQGRREHLLERHLEVRVPGASAARRDHPPGTPRPLPGSLPDRAADRGDQRGFRGAKGALSHWLSPHLSVWLSVCLADRHLVCLSGCLCVWRLSLPPARRAAIDRRSVLECTCGRQPPAGPS